MNHSAFQTQASCEGMVTKGKKCLCQICSSRQTHVIFHQENVPVFCNILYDTPQQALNAPRGKINLVQCENCGYIFNSEFDENKLAYEGRYENPLHHSPTFKAYADQLAQMLVDNFQMKSRRVLEIGCGDGDFMKRLRKMGAGVCVGYDPSCRESSEDGIEFVTESYDPKQEVSNYDLICMRQVLEHISDPKAFLGALARSMYPNPGAVLFIEVPSAEAVFSHNLIWDILYEHKSYFTASSLDYLLKDSGFDVLASWPSFGGQFLCFAVRHAIGRYYRPIANTPALCRKFNKHYHARLMIYHHCMRLFRKHGQKVAVWGGGTKGINFTNAMGGDSSAIACLVDINNFKQGKYIPISAKPVISPVELRRHRPDIVIVMNENYKKEIVNSLNLLGVRASLLLA